MKLKLYTKEELIEKLKELRNQGWVKNGRFGNVGGIGNTVEDYLGIEENNLPIPNAVEWELKAQRINTSSLTTLFHMEPSPRAVKFVPSILLPFYGWNHNEAGAKYSDKEKSFRQTITGVSHTDRGFIVNVDRVEKRVEVSFDSSKVDKERHSDWIKSIEEQVGLGELSPQPYWGFPDLEHKVGTKLLNCFYVQADQKKEDGIEYYWYKNIMILKGFDFEKFLKGIENGSVLVDFDARTGHNHGTKFRLKQNYLPELYKESISI